MIKHIIGVVVLVVLFVLALCLFWAFLKAFYLKLFKGEPFLKNFKETLFELLVEVILEGINPLNWF